MARPEVLGETPITISELKAKLSKVRKRDEELNYRANKTEEYINQLFSLDEKKAKELREKLEGLGIPRLKIEHIVKIIDLLPTTANDLKVILQGFTVSINADNGKKIVDVVAKYAPKDE